MDGWHWLEQQERPRFCRLENNLCAAAFSLMKLTPARFMIERALAAGALKQGGHIVETTSGTFGLALSLLAAAGGFRLTLVSADSLIDEQFRRRLAFLGTEIVTTEDPDRNGDQHGRLTKLRAILADNPGAYWPHQYDNPDNRLAYDAVARQVLDACGHIDVVVGTVGTGGSLFGITAGLMKRGCTLEVVAVDTHRSVLFGQPAGRRQLRGLGNSIMPANIAHHMVDEVHWVGALPAYASAHHLLRHHGLFVGPTSGAAMLVARHMARQHPNATVLAILPDEGHRYAETVFSKTWLDGLHGWPFDCPDRPVVLDWPIAHDETAWTTLSWGKRNPQAMEEVGGGLLSRQGSVP